VPLRIAKKGTEERLKGLTEEEAMSIHLLTQDSPFTSLLNQRLSDNNRKLLKGLLPFLKLLLTALYKLPTSKATFYRGVQEDISPTFKDGSILIWWTFTPVLPSLPKEIDLPTRKEGKTLLAVHAESAVDVSYFSADQKEEFLLLPSTTLVMEAEEKQEAANEKNEDETQREGSQRKEGTTILHLREKKDSKLLLDFPRPSRTFLPPRNESFVGRTRELEELAAKLDVKEANKGFSQVVLRGAAGIGKSSLALEYAHLHYEKYSFVRWIPLRGEVGEEIKHAAVSLGLVPNQAPLNQAAEAFKAFLEHLSSAWLLVFDDAGERELLRPALPDPSKAKGHVVVIARSPLGWEEESLFLVPPLCPLDSELLLWQNSGKGKMENLHGGEREALEEIIEELGSFPLALVQVGAYIAEEKGGSFADYLSRLKEQRDQFQRQEMQMLEKEDLGTIITCKLSLAKLQRSFPESLPALHRSLFVAASDIPSSLITEEPSLLAPLLRLRFLYKTKSGTFCLHPLTHSLLREGLQESEKVVALEQVAAALYEEWASDDGSSATWETSKHLVPHAEALVSLGVCNEKVAFLLYGLGSYYWSMEHNLPKAVECYQKSLAMRRKIYGEEHPSIAQSLSNLGSAFSQQGDLSAALECFSQSLEMRRKLHGPEHPYVASSLSLLGSAYLLKRELSEAVNCLSLALEIKKNFYGEEHPDVAASLNSLGAVLLEKGNSSMAVEKHLLSLRIYQKIFGDEHPDIAMTLNHLGLAFERLGDLEKAGSFLGRSLEMFLKFSDPWHPSVKKTLESLRRIQAHAKLE